MMKEAIEHGGDGSAIAEKFAPVVDRSLRVPSMVASAKSSSSLWVSR
ncbi:MAG: hypothetical protein ABSD75_17835 [Terriglobales bacterium]|jgi:hypothetical protein